MFREISIRIARRRSLQFATGIAVTGAILVFASGPWMRQVARKS